MEPVGKLPHMNSPVRLLPLLAATSIAAVAGPALSSAAAARVKVKAGTYKVTSSKGDKFITLGTLGYLHTVLIKEFLQLRVGPGVK